MPNAGTHWSSSPFYRNLEAHGKDPECFPNACVPETFTFWLVIHILISLIISYFSKCPEESCLLLHMHLSLCQHWELPKLRNNFMWVSKSSFRKIKLKTWHYHPIWCVSMKEKKKKKVSKLKLRHLLSYNRNFLSKSSHDMLTDTNGPGFGFARLRQQCGEEIEAVLC